MNTPLVIGLIPIKQLFLVILVHDNKEIREVQFCLVCVGYKVKN